MAAFVQQVANTGPLTGVADAVVTSSRATPQFASLAAAIAVVLPPAINQTIVDGDIYRRVTINPYTKRAYQDASGQWFTAIKLRADGPIEVWVAWGQSEMRAVTGSPGSVSGRRSAESYVLVYARGLTGRPGLPDLPDGWYAVGPEDEAFAFYTSLVPVGAVWYREAAARARQIGGTVCVVPYAIGGAESGKFVQGGTMWAGLQASWSGAMAAPLPGRGGKSLNDINGVDPVTGAPRTRAAVMAIWQGSADADYKFGQPDAATSGDVWVQWWRQILNSLQSPSGASVPITSAMTRIIFFEMLHGATSGGAPGVGFPTDDRNRDLHKLLRYDSGKRHQIRIVPMEGVNFFTSDPSVTGSFDNLHLNSAAYDEASRRFSFVLSTFDFGVHDKDTVIINASGFTVCRPDGTFSSWSMDLTAATVSVAAGPIFRSSYTLWTIPMPAGYAVSGTPNVSPCQCSVLTVWPCIHTIPAAAQTYLMAATSQASPVTYRVQATGFWQKT